LHLLYPDERGDIRHKILSAPYSPDNWSPKAGEDIPGELVVTGTDDDLTIALDYSLNPATIKPKIPTQCVKITSRPEERYNYEAKTSVKV